MEDILLYIHSILRYAVILFGIYAITKSARGLMKKQAYTPNHNRSAILFVALVHLQVVIGLYQYFAKGLYKNIQMGDTLSRFWGMEHLVGMLLAAFLIQIGRTKSKNAFEHPKKHKKALVFFSIGLLVILASIPWPFREALGISEWWPTFPELSSS